MCCKQQTFYDKEQKENKMCDPCCATCHDKCNGEEMCCGVCKEEDILNLTAKDLRKIRDDSAKKAVEDFLKKERERKEALNKEVISILKECKEISENENTIECSLYLDRVTLDAIGILRGKGFEITSHYEGCDPVHGVTILW